MDFGPAVLKGEAPGGFGKEKKDKAGAERISDDAALAGGGDPMVILDLCGGTGAWSQPYRDAGYDVRVITLPAFDVRRFDPPTNVHGILAAPPCTEFARVGARWWPSKPPALLTEAIDIVRACLRIVRQAAPSWWALENPIGRIAACVPELGPPRLKVHPCDFGDPWTKRIWLWGDFAPLFFRPIVPRFHPTQPPRRRDRTSLLSSTQRAERAQTPAGFARAFFESNP